MIDDDPIFIITITEKIESDLLNDILISTFDNFEIDEKDFNNIISTLIEKGKFGKIYSHILMNNKFFIILENLIKNFIIKDDIEEFINKNNFNNL